MADLHLNLKTEFFLAIQNGSKQFEYRLWSKWQRRLEGKTFDRVIIKRGYPKAYDDSRILVRPWRGYELTTVQHPLFGDQPVQVAAIPVN